MQIWQTLVQALTMYLALLFVTRWEGKKQISQLTFFNYVSGIAIGSIAANGVVGELPRFYTSLVAIAAWAGLTVVTDIVVLKSRRSHLVINGEPTTIIERGKVLERNMAKSRLNMDELRTMLRAQKVFRLADVEFATLETSGKLSVQKMPWAESVTRQDLGLNLTRSAPGVELILDGMVDEDKLRAIGRERQWLVEHFCNEGINDLRKVQYAELYPNGQLYYDLKEQLED